MTYHYTYLITNLKPLVEKYYIGVRSCSCNPYNDTYMGSSTILTNAIKNHSITNFEKVIIEIWPTRKLAEIHENELHLTHSAAINPIFYNVKNGVLGFHYNEKARINQKQTINNPEWKETIGKIQREKQSKTKSSKEWKETIGKEKIRKYKEIINDPEWKKTLGVSKSNNIKSARLDPDWKKTVGKQAKEKELNTKSDIKWIEEVWKPAMQQRTENINSVDWKETSGVIQKRRYQQTINSDKYKYETLPKLRAKMKGTLTSEDYKKKHTYKCPHCDYIGVGPANYKRWHGDNCKYK